MPIEIVGSSLKRVLAYSKDHDYLGYSKFDALNSPYLEAIFGWNALGRLLITQFVNRFWLHVRPLLGVTKSRNPKGIANFIKAYCNLYRLYGRPEDKASATALSDWLLENHANQENEYHGLCWGYNFPWQSPGFYAPRHSPNCIVSVFCGEALLDLFRISGNNQYLHYACETARFILTDLPVLEDSDRHKCIGYVPVGLRWKVININAVTAGFLSGLAWETGDNVYLENARRMIRWTIEHRTSYNAWPYTLPPSASGIGHDNYHTGGILDGISDFMKYSGEDWPLDVYEKGLTFYRDQLFSPEGAPNWTDQKQYPRDIHGSAQGVLTFVRAARHDPERLEFANKLANWAIRFMQNEDGHFYYRRHRCFTRKECLMRWNNSWMSWALSELLLARTELDKK